MHHQRHEQTTPPEDVAVGIVDTGRDGRREEGNQEAPHPIDGRGQGGTRGPALRRAHDGRLAPGDRAPGAGEPGDEQGRRPDEDPAGGWCPLRRLAVQPEPAGRGVDDEEQRHPQRAQEQAPLPPKPLGEIEPGDGAEDVDQAENRLGDVAVGDAGAGKHRGSVVEEEIDPRQLLEGQDTGREQDARPYMTVSQDLLPLC